MTNPIPSFRMTERTWPSVLLTPISVDNHVITVNDTFELKVKMEIVLSKAGLDSEQFEIKRILSRTTLMVGPVGKPISKISEAAKFTGGTLSANEQSRNKLGDAPILRAVYSEEPTMAIRTLLVDSYGDRYTSIVDTEGNVRLAVDANLSLDNLIFVGAVGSHYSEVNSVASGVLTNILTYTAPIGKTTFLQKIEVSGTNITEYTMYINGVKQDRRRSYFGSNFNEVFIFATTAFSVGLPLVVGDIVTVKVFHTRPFPSDYNSRVQVLEI